MQLKYFFITILFAIFASSSIADEILSKKDTARTFNKSFNEWKIDAKRIDGSGYGESVQSDAISIAMIVFVNDSILKISPVYTEKNTTRPWKIAVAVEHNEAQTQRIKRLGDDGMRALAGKWYQEMQPEYSVMTEFDLLEDTLQINFSIFEAGTNLIIDKVAKETMGCWQGCIKR